MADLAVGDIIKNITDDVKLLYRTRSSLPRSSSCPPPRTVGLAPGCSEPPDTSRSARPYCSISLLPSASSQQAWQRGSHS